MNRVIINIDDGISIEDALLYVERVVQDGRVSKDGQSFCYATRFRDDTIVLANTTENGTDTFRVCREEQNNG